MKKINFNFNFQDLAGNDIPDSNAGQFLANVLVSISTKDPIKMNAMAQQMYKKKVLELDPSDIELLKTTIINNESMTNGAKAQLLMKL